ncbi:MAG: carboxypeptidase-like regulatory domain-containing protein [Candidatus Binataceae bacterium]
MRKLAILPIGLMLGCFLAFAANVHAAEPGAHPGWIWGTVKTAYNNPAPNVPVAVAKVENGKTQPPMVKTMTNKKGRYRLDVKNLPAGKYVMIINPGPKEAGGYVGGQKLITLNGPNTSRRVDWTLEKMPPTKAMSKHVTR